ncbi:MAG: GtrA family protein [Candidatus Berkelbacteria bacterium]|nr:GtrA family protein [Candidatus Berkelbacteria bacterium]
MTNEEEFVSKRTGVQFVKFALVGIINTGVDWIVFFLLTLIPFFRELEWLAKTISFLVSATNSFIMNSFWTFKKEFKGGLDETKGQKAAKGTSYYIKFMIVSLIGWGLNTLIFYICRYKIFENLPQRRSQFISLFFASGIVVIWNFLANKLWTYKD